MKKLIISLALCLPLMVCGQYEDWSGEGETVTTSVSSLEEYDLYGPNYENAGTYLKDAVKNRSHIPYPNLREGDVSWARRYERVIDARQKKNLVMLYPRASFTNLLMKAAWTGIVPVYHNRDLDSIIPTSKVPRIGEYTILTSIPDPSDPSLFYDTLIPQMIRWEEIKKFRIMEEWVFDKKHGTMIPRIVAIAPLYTPVIANGTITLPEQPMYWVRYEDLRPTLANSEVFNRGNDAGRISYDHFFEARMFDSYIVKEPNVLDLDIAQYPEYENNGLGALLEADMVRNDLFLTEHDLWEY